jgi:hypothetical protein
MEDVRHTNRQYNDCQCIKYILRCHPSSLPNRCIFRVALMRSGATGEVPPCRAADPIPRKGDCVESRHIYLVTILSPVAASNVKKRKTA